MSFLNDLKDAQDFLNNNSPLGSGNADQFKKDGFLLPASYNADGIGLPYSKSRPHKPYQVKRNIISWFVPQFGLIKMYINPEGISYANKKIIQKDRTKGGYTLQYWGEDLTTITLHGTTGSSGIEGINMLYEIYRAEQYAFDSVGLTMAANNFNNDLSHNLLNGAASLFGGSPQTQSGVSNLLSGILGVSSPNNSLSAKNIPSLAQLAFTVEMFYNGWVYRGFFESMTVNEKANNFLIDYNIVFHATQRRGYRVNNFPWARTPIYGQSEYNTPHSFSEEEKLRLGNPGSYLSLEKINRTNG